MDSDLTIQDLEALIEEQRDLIIEYEDAWSTATGGSMREHFSFAFIKAREDLDRYTQLYHSVRLTQELEAQALHAHPQWGMF